MYSGPELPQDEVCFLVKPKFISITSLGGYPAPTAWLSGVELDLIPSSVIGGEKLVELLPGSHNLAVNFAYYYSRPYGYDYTSGYVYTNTSKYSSEEDVLLTFEGVAGRIYAIRPDSDEIVNFCLKGDSPRRREWWGDTYLTSWQPRIEDITNSEYANEKILPNIRKHKAKLGN